MAKVNKNKTEKVLTINTNLINKTEIFKMLALAHSTGLPLLLEGPPGTAKTRAVLDYAKSWMLSHVDKTNPEQLAQAGRDFMEKVFILETDEGTKASEVKGMPDISEMFTNNKYHVNTPIAEAEIVIINEIDKASSAIRNSLLGVMNEKFIFNGKDKVPCKWKLFIGTCNEIPKGEEKSPFWDRFVLKKKVSRVNAGEIVSYYAKGGRTFSDTVDVNLPSKEEINSVDVNTNKFEKFLDIGYAHCSDRTLTYVPNLVRTVSKVWEESVDNALVRVAGLMINNSAGSALKDLLMNPEVKSLLSKIEMLNSISNEEGLEAHVKEIEALLGAYTSNGKVDAEQVREIETAIYYVLDNHPIRSRDKEGEREVEDFLNNSLVTNGLTS